jgi:hypothetical protein
LGREVAKFHADGEHLSDREALADKKSAKPVDLAVSFAASKGLGYTFTAYELKAGTKAAGKELSDADLDGVAGGVALAGIAGLFMLAGWIASAAGW